MKVWVIGRGYPEPLNNMTGTFEFDQAKMLQKNGENVCYICCSLHPTKVIKAWGFQSWKEDGVTVCTYSLRFFPRVFPFYFVKIRNLIWKNFFQCILEEYGSPNIIHVHYPAMLMIADALYMFHQMGVKIIVTEHWTKVLAKSLDAIETRAFRRYFEYIDACICVGSPLKNAIKTIVRNNKIPFYIIPNIVDREFQPSLKTIREDFEFIAVGRLTQVKQFDQIIHAFSECFRGKKVKLTIVGGGEEYNSLKNLVIMLGMETQITLTGSQSRKKVAQYIAHSDCLVCFSRFETFGVPIIEAWACGIPTIATTAAAAIIDNFDSKLGIEVNYNNVMELKEKMEYMYNNISSYNKKFITAFSQKNFSEDVIYRKLKNIYIG